MITEKKILETGEHIKSAYEISTRFVEFHERFNIQVPYQVFLDTESNEELKITKPILTAITHFENIDEEMISRISKEALSHYERCIETTDFGIATEELRLKYNDDLKQINHQHFNINSTESAFENLKPIEVLITQKKDENQNEYVISCWQFDVPWESEHGMVIHLKNGEISLVE